MRVLVGSADAPGDWGHAAQGCPPAASDGSAWAYKHIATGCVASPTETKPPREAEQALSDYIAKKYQPERRRRDIEEIDCADVLSIYLADAGNAGNEFDDLNARVGRLNEFWGGKMLAAVNSHECGEYVMHRGNRGGSRRDLETLRAAINHHANQGFHRGIVRVSLPPKGCNIGHDDPGTVRYVRLVAKAARQKSAGVH